MGLGSLASYLCIYRPRPNLTPNQLITMAVDISTQLKKKKKQILELWMNNQLSNVTLRDDDLRAQSDELLDEFLKSINSENLHNPESPDFENVREILSGISMSRARQGFSPKETGLYVFSLKDAVITLLQQEVKNDPLILAESTLQISRLFDNFGVATFETFIKGREDIILRQTDEITEISTPVIKVWEGILALPIIGTLDSARTQVVMENLLQQIVDTGSSIAILDISGVPAVDSLVAQHLLKTVSATRLMGAECIVSGIRPEIAQTVVHLGIDLSNIITKASLAHALKHAFAVLQLEVRKKQRENTSLKNN
jgi:rsbT co-antagonist protein RsbR